MAREKLIELLKEAPFEGQVLDYWWFEEKIARIADHLIANGVTVRAKGKWNCLEAEIGYYACTLCDHRILRAKCNYCPNCGADMRGAEHETD